MKKTTLRLMAIAALTALVVFSTAACNGGTTTTTPPAVPLPATITVSGIPAGFHGGPAEMTLRATATGNFVAASDVQAAAGTTAFAFNALLPANYDIRLRLTDAYGFSYYFRVPSMFVAAGASTIVFDDSFDPIPPIQITVTGMPAVYTGGFLPPPMELWQSGSMVANDRFSVRDTETETVLFTMNGIIPGNYEIRLPLTGAGGIPRLYRIALLFIGPQDNIIPFDDFQFMEPISITVSGIPAQYHGQSGRIDLFSGGEPAGFGQANEISGTTGFAVHGLLAGNYELQLTLNYVNWIPSLYRIASMSIIDGNNPIELDQFTHIPPIQITVTGLEDYLGWSGNMTLYQSGDFAGSDSSGEINSDTANFTVRGVIPGDFEIYLRLFDAGWIITREYHIATRALIAGINEIPLSDFTPPEPPALPIVITITGIPARYHGDNSGGIELLLSGELAGGAFVFYITEATDFVVENLEPGTYDIRMGLLDADGALSGYLLDGAVIAAGTNEIPLSDFTHIPPIPPIQITVTGIPALYDGGGASIQLLLDGEDAGWSFADVENGTAVFTLSDVSPGTFRIELELIEDGWENTSNHYIASRAIYAGDNQIPFDDFDEQQ
ncbi:MAG: hypothetical protein FWC64_04495 [Treponema sp.]|nr:hypothetical protein [Treponema sp.]